MTEEELLAALCVMGVTRRLHDRSEYCSDNITVYLWNGHLVWLHKASEAGVPPEQVFENVRRNVQIRKNKFRSK